MKLTASLGSTGGLVGCTVPTIAGLACSATTSPTPTAAGLSFSNKDDLAKFVGGACVNGLLDPKEKTLLAKENIDTSAWSSTDKFKASSGDARGCLAVSWTKQTWKDDYWKGIIRYEWLFTKGAETMVVHGFLDSNDTGIGNNNWKAVYINTNGEKKAWQVWNKTVSSDADLEKKMPKRPSFFSGNDDYWSFNPDYKKECQKNQNKCVGSPTNKYFESTWKWRSHSGGSHLFSGWATNYSDVFDEHLDSLKDVVKEKGTWESF